MLGTGQSRHNTHTGQTTVRQGDMLIDGSLRVRGDLIIDGNVVFNSDVVFNGDITIAAPNCLNTNCINSLNVATTGITINQDYTLPINTSGSTVGDVLTLTSLTPPTCDFTTPSTASGRVIQNFFQMTNPRFTYGSIHSPLWLNKDGSEVIIRDLLSVGSTVRLRTKGYFYNGAGAGTTTLGQFRITIGVGNTSGTSNFYSSSSIPVKDAAGMGPTYQNGRGWFEIEVDVTKLDASNNCTIGVSGLISAVDTTAPTENKTFDLQFYDDPTTFTTRLPNSSSSNLVSPAPFWSPLPATFTLQVGWARTGGDANAIASEYTIDFLNTNTNVLATTTAPATDHNTLANLNVGDPHQLYAYLDGRSGGQILSGGITPAHFLTLKSHNAGLNNVVIKDLNTTFEKDIDMNTNDITNANVIVRASNGNIIDMNNDIAPPLLTGALTIDAGAGKQARLTADSFLELAGNVIAYNSKGGSHQFTNTAEGTILTLGSEIGANKNLNMLLNNIDNCPQVSNGGGVLSLFGDGRTDIGIIAGGSRFEVEDTQVSVIPFADFVIQNKIRYVQPGVMPTVFDDGVTYIFVGSRTTSTPIVLNGISVTFKGSSRETSSIEYTGAGSFITTTDCDFSLIDLTLKCNVAGSLLLTASNPSKLNVLSILNCEVRESYEFADISGHELVDINNTLFIHLRGDGVLTNQKCLYINGVAKTNITSCEIVKFFEIGQPANTNPFDGAMIYITGACGAVSIIGGIIHPRVNQKAVEIDNTATFLEFALNTNNFIDIGLLTPTTIPPGTGAILETNSNLNWDTNATSESNSLLPNLKSFVGAQLSAQNTNNTATVLNNPIDINLGTLLTPFSSFGTAVAGTGGVTYVRKRPVNFQVTFVANLQAITGGSGQRIALSVSKNGFNTGIKSFVTLDSAGTEPKQCTLTLVGQANQGDIFRSQLINESTSSDIRCLDLLISGIEI